MPVSVQSRVNVYYVNAGRMRSKLFAFFAAVATCDYDAIVVTESWLAPSINDAELTPSGWICFRKDRHNDTSSTSLEGGVLILVRPSTSVSNSNSVRPNGGTGVG